MTREISNSDDIIDSREVIERIAELEGIFEDADAEMSTDEIDELNTLRELAREGEGIADWPYGATLVRDSYFVDYAQDLAEGIGAIDSNASWPNTYIDWERAADALQMDYTPVEFDGVTYWVR